MRLAIQTVAYHEERLIPKFIQHYRDKVEEILVTNTTKPWFGEADGSDKTAVIARSLGATVIEYPWVSEAEQRNAANDYLMSYDWVIVLDPDEYFSDNDWQTLVAYLDQAAGASRAVIVEGQFTYWKNGYVADPPRDYQQLVAVRPDVRFVDKRVVGSPFTIAPVWLHHFSWARTDQEVWRKISHYAHANDFDVTDWYTNVWEKWEPGFHDVHPVTPETLHKLVPATLPKELQELSLWPTEQQ